jgi:hypothetical protein
LQVDGLNSADGAAITQGTDNGGANQLWDIPHLGNGYYQLRNVHSQKLLDAAGCAQGTHTRQWSDNSSAADLQRWTITTTVDGRVKLSPACSNNQRILDVGGGDPNAGAAVLLSGYGNIIGNNQQWTLVRVAAPPAPTIADGTYQLRVQHSGKLLEVSGSSSTNGAQLQQRGYTGGSNQQWKITHLGDQWYEVRVVHSGKLLDAGACGGGTHAQQADPRTPAAPQRWKFIPTASADIFKLASECNPGLVLDVSGVSPNDGAHVILSSNGTVNDANQQWKLEPVTNLVLNPSFEQDGAPTSTPQGWFTNDNASADYVENDGMAQHGSYHGTHWSSRNYKVYTYQVITGLTPGLYTLRAWVKRSEGLSHTTMVAKNFGGAPYEEYISPTVTGPDPGAWRQVQITGLSVTNGQCEIAFYSDGTGSQPNAGQWMHFDNVEFFKQPSTPSATSSASLMRAATPAAPAGSRLELYPNPAQDQVTVSSSFAQAREVEVTILTAQGKKAASYRHQVPAGSAQFSVPTRALPAGMYLLHLQDGTQQQTQRLVVTH